MLRHLAYASLCIFFMSPTIATAADKSIGQREYENKCVMCHGAAGKGDGWFTTFLKTPPSSLTRLKNSNGGVFPFDRVYEVLDGRKQVLAHGPREMPVWGAQYRSESGKEYDAYYGLTYVDEGVVRAKILALIDYLSQLQE